MSDSSGTPRGPACLILLQCAVTELDHPGIGIVNPLRLVLGAVTHHDAVAIWKIWKFSVEDARDVVHIQPIVLRKLIDGG